MAIHLPAATHRMREGRRKGPPRRRDTASQGAQRQRQGPECEVDSGRQLARRCWRVGGKPSSSSSSARRPGERCCCASRPREQAVPRQGIFPPLQAVIRLCTIATTTSRGYEVRDTAREQRLPRRSSQRPRGCGGRWRRPQHERVTRLRPAAEDGASGRGSSSSRRPPRSGHRATLSPGQCLARLLQRPLCGATRLYPSLLAAVRRGRGVGGEGKGSGGSSSGSRPLAN